MRCLLSCLLETTFKSILICIFFAKKISTKHSFNYNSKFVECLLKLSFKLIDDCFVPKSMEICVKSMY